MKKMVKLIPAATLLMMLTPALMTSLQVQAANDVAVEQTQQKLAGNWVDLSGRAVLTISGNTATFSRDAEPNENDRYQLKVEGNKLTFIPENKKAEQQSLQAKLVDDKKITLKKGIYDLELVPTPEVTAEMLDGYWRSEGMDHNTKNIRAIEYKNNATSYDYYWWRVNQGYGTYQTHIDKDVPLVIKNGFILTTPGADNRFLVYATKVEADKIHYVDTSGDRWVEVKTDKLEKFTPKKGFKEMKSWMMP